MIETLLELLSDKEFVALYEKVIRERRTVTWPPPENEEEQKANLKHLHGTMAALGFDRHLSEALRDAEAKVSRDLEERRARGGILMS